MREVGFGRYKGDLSNAFLLRKTMASEPIPMATRKDPNSGVVIMMMMSKKYAPLKIIWLLVVQYITPSMSMAYFPLNPVGLGDAGAPRVNG